MWVMARNILSIFDLNITIYMFRYNAPLYKVPLQLLLQHIIIVMSLYGIIIHYNTYMFYK